jgi:hypothetical protein
MPVVFAAARIDAAIVLRALALVMVVGAVTACGGRVANPVSAANPWDGQLDCVHLKAELDVNRARVADLAGEAKNSAANNVGLFLVNPLFLDLKDSEKAEIRAFAEREKTLKRLMDEKSCSG